MFKGGFMNEGVMAGMLMAVIFTTLLVCVALVLARKEEREANSKPPTMPRPADHGVAKIDRKAS